MKKSVARNVAQSSLKKKGFVEITKPKGRRGGKDHYYYHHEYNGQRTIAYTKISHSPKFRVLSGDMLVIIKKQLQLDSQSDVLDLLTCPMDEEKYNNILINKGLLPR